MKQSNIPSNSNVEAEETSVYEPRRYQIPRDVPIGAYNRDELINLLAYFEGELQARDIALSVLKSEQKDNEKNDHLLKSLQSDLSNLNVVDHSEVYVQLYPNQFRHLNRLVDAQKEYQKKFAERLLETEDQHAKKLFELRDKLEETEKSIDKTKNGLCSVLEERIDSLKNECARKQEELDKLDTELRNRDKEMEAEKERQKTIILFMLSERKHLLSLIHQMTLKMKDNPNSEQDTSSNIVGELKKQLRIVCEERNGFSRQCNTLQSEKANLLNIIHNLEEDIVSLKTSTFINKPTEIGVGGHVFANKAVTELPSQMSEVNNTGTVRFNKWPKDQQQSKGPSSFPTKSYESNFQHTNVINGNISQRHYANDSSNLPRPSNTPRSHPAMGIRGSQLRNNRPTMGISAQNEDNHIIHPQSNFHIAQFPTTASDMSTTYVQSSRSQVRMIPIHEQSATSSSSNIIVIPQSDNRISKRSTSLPRKMSNGEIVVTTKSPTQPLSPSKIRPPTQNHHAAPPNFQPPIPQRGHQKQSHTHIS